MTTQLATGISRLDDSHEATQSAVQAALSKLSGRRPGLAMVYCGTKHSYEVVIKTAREMTGGAPLIGCSTGGEFTEESTGSGAVAVGLIASDIMRFTTAMAVGIAKDELGALKKVVGQIPLDDTTYPHKAALLVLDGLRGKGAEVTVAAANLLGLMVPMVGGAAGDDLKFKETQVFCDDTVATDAAALCLMESKTPFFTSVKHGHIPLSEELVATKAAGSVLHEVNGRPAWDVWVEKAGPAAKELGIDIENTKDTSLIGRFLVRFELGLVETDGSYIVRVPLSRNDDGSLGFACTIPQGASFRIMNSVEQNQIESARDAMRQAKSLAGSTPIAGALVFDCVCRRLILGDQFHVAVDEAKRILGANVPLLGWETYGEVCMHPGEFSGFHNTTSVVMLLGQG